MSPWLRGLFRPLGSEGAVRPVVKVLQLQLGVSWSRSRSLHPQRRGARRPAGSGRAAPALAVLGNSGCSSGWGKEGTLVYR